MALKVGHVSDIIPNLDQKVGEINAALPIIRPDGLFQGGVENDGGKTEKKQPSQPSDQRKFVVMGHRGSGMNLLQSPDQRMKAIKENSIHAFNAARRFNVDFIEFDVQVTRDGCPVIFHDIFILTEEKGMMIEKRVTDLSLDEFLSHGPQRDPQKVGKPLWRKSKDGRIFAWKVEEDDHLCTLQEVFEQVDPSLGFNIELKFDNNAVYEEEHLRHVVNIVLQVVFEHAKDRHVIFSSFQPDAILLTRKLQSTYPVFFLTNGGSEIYPDERRNSLEAALNLCLQGGLQGIVSEVEAILRNTGAIDKIKQANLSLLTYGQLNNMPEVVHMQYLLGIEGVIVDLVEEITEIVMKFSDTKVENQELSQVVKAGNIKTAHCFEDEISDFLRLIPAYLVNA